jgi:hypothetical protein
MATKHELSLEVLETTNPKLFRVVDTSAYSKDLSIECPTLQILSPGFNSTQDIDAVAGFNYVLNACTLGVQMSGCDTTSADLGDGIYVIRYSVSPNEYVYVEYNHLRMTQALNLYYEKLGEVDLGAYDPTDTQLELLGEMRLIKSMFDAAKAKVEYCHEPKEGYDLFVYALKRLEKVCV